MDTALNKIKDGWLWGVDLVEAHPHATLVLIAVLAIAVVVF